MLEMCLNKTLPTDPQIYRHIGNEKDHNLIVDCYGAASLWV